MLVYQMIQSTTDSASNVVDLLIRETRSTITHGSFVAGHGSHTPITQAGAGQYTAQNLEGFKPHDSAMGEFMFNVCFQK